MKYEVEQKFWVLDHSELERKLDELGAQAEARIEQVDAYFRHPSRDFGQTDEALRIRRVGDDNFVTYKGPKIDTTTKTRREIELPIEPGEMGAARFAELLEALSFSREAEVRKTRRPYTLKWEALDVEIALDEVEQLGTFAELELQAEEPDLETAKAALASLAKQLALEKNERRSYLEMLLENT